MTTRDPERRPRHAAPGDIPPWWTAVPRRRLAVAIGSTFVAVPVVVVDNLPRHEPARALAVEATAPADDRAPSSTTSTSTSTTLPPAPETTITVVVEPAEPPATTTTTAPPATTAPAPVTARRVAPATTTTAAPPPAPTTTAPAPAPTGRGSQSGQATWYRWRDGECAHRTLPRGTVVTITNRANGRTATCTVTDRGPYGAGRIIDLDDGTFASLAPLSAGVIDVTISW